MGTGRHRRRNAEGGREADGRMDYAERESDITSESLLPETSTEGESEIYKACGGLTPGGGSDNGMTRSPRGRSGLKADAITMRWS